MKRITLGIIGLAALAAVAMAAVDGLSLKRTPKEGQTIKYKMEGQIDMQGMQIGIKATMQEKVLKVETNGNFSVEQQNVEGKVTLPDGNEMDMPAGTATTTTYMPDGQVVEIKGGSEDGTSYRTATLGLLVDPGKALNVGDKWSHTVKADTKTGTVAATAEYQVMGEEKVGNFDTIKVKASVKETSGDTPASSESTSWVNKVDGTTVKAEMKWSKAPFPSPAGPMIIDATIKLTRVE